MESSQYVTVGTADKPDWFYLVDADDETLKVLRGNPGIIVDKNRLLIHRNVVCSDSIFKIVYVDPNGWAGPKNIDPQVYSVYEKILRPYQREFVDFSINRPGIVNGDDVGTGKSLQALVAIAASGYVPVLIVGTLLSKSVWCGPKSEPTKWLGIDVQPLESRKNAGPEIFQQATTKWFFCHYDVLEAWLPWIFTFLRPHAVVFDEAHNASPRTKKGRAAESIARFKEIRKRIVLTATPVRNKRIDLWGPLNLAAPDSVGDRHGFGIRFCAGVHGEYGWVYPGESHNEELKLRLKELMVRRTKGEVMPQLPPLTRQGVEIELDSASAEEYSKYKAAEHDIRKFLLSQGTPLPAGISGERLVQLTKMLNILSHAKYPTTVTLAKEAAETTGKAVAFCWFKDVARLIAKDLKKQGLTVYGPVTGEDSIKKRIDAAQAFADDTEPAVFVATLAAASESINQLAAAQELIINDLYWNPKLLIQTEGRLHRGGQLGSVHVQYALGKNTIDDDLLLVLYRKAEASEVLGLREDSKALIKSIGSATAPTDDLDVFVAAVQKHITDGGYGFDDGEIT